MSTNSKEDTVNLTKSKEEEVNLDELFNPFENKEEEYKPSSSPTEKKPKLNIDKERLNSAVNTLGSATSKATSKLADKTADGLTAVTKSTGKGLINSLNPGSFLMIFLIGVLTYTLIMPITPISYIISDLAGFFISPLAVAIFLMILSVMSTLIPIADRKLGEKQLPLTESKELKNTLKELWDDKDYHSTIDRVVFFRQHKLNEYSGSYAIGTRKISICDAQIQGGELGVITHEIAHIRFKDTVFSGVLHTLIKWNMLFYTLPIKLMSIPFWILGVFYKPSRVVAKTILYLTYLIESFALFMINYIQLLASKSAEYRADAYTINNGTANELIQVFRNMGDENLTLLETVKQSLYSSHPKTSSRISRLERLIEKKEQSDLAKQARKDAQEAITMPSFITDTSKGDFY